MQYYKILHFSKTIKYFSGSPQLGTGPGYDHTTGLNGYYMAANPKEATDAEDTARLLSATYFSGQKASCVFPFEYNVGVTNVT